MRSLLLLVLLCAGGVLQACGHRADVGRRPALSTKVLKASLQRISRQIVAEPTVVANDPTESSPPLPEEPTPPAVVPVVPAVPVASVAPATVAPEVVVPSSPAPENPPPDIDPTPVTGDGVEGGGGDGAEGGGGGGTNAEGGEIQGGVVTEGSEADGSVNSASSGGGGSIEASGGRPLSRNAILGISIGGAAFVVAVLTVVLVVVLRRRSGEADESYYRFTDAAGDHPPPGRDTNEQSAHTNPAPPGGATPSYGPPYNAPANSAGMGQTPAYGETAMDGSGAPPFNTPGFVPGHSHMTSSVGSAERLERAYYSNIAGPTAPSMSQFSRRDSDASSTSSDPDVIVAPVYRNGQNTMTAGHAAPWFHDARSTGQAQPPPPPHV